MGQTTQVNLAAGIPEVWQYNVKFAYTTKVLMEKLVETYIATGAKTGDIHHFPILGVVVASAVGSDGSFTPDNQTETDRTVTIDKWYHASKDIAKNTVDLTKLDVVKGYSKVLGSSIAKQIDTSLLGNSADWTGTAVGTAAAPVQISGGNIRDAVLQLDKNDVDDVDRGFIISPQGWNELLSDGQLSNAAAIGASLAQNPVMKGANIGAKSNFAPSGVPIYVSNNLPSSGTSRLNQMIHLPQLALFRASPMEFQKVDQTAAKILAILLVTDAFYGTGTLLRAGGVIVHGTL